MGVLFRDSCIHANANLQYCMYKKIHFMHSTVIKKNRIYF